MGWLLGNAIGGSSQSQSQIQWGNQQGISSGTAIQLQQQAQLQYSQQYPNLLAQQQQQGAFHQAAQYLSRQQKVMAAYSIVELKLAVGQYVIIIDNNLRIVEGRIKDLFLDNANNYEEASISILRKDRSLYLAPVSRIQSIPYLDNYKNSKLYKMVYQPPEPQYLFNGNLITGALSATSGSIIQYVP